MPQQSMSLTAKREIAEQRLAQAKQALNAINEQEANLRRELKRLLKKTSTQFRIRVHKHNHYDGELCDLPVDGYIDISRYVYLWEQSNAPHEIPMTQDEQDDVNKLIDTISSFCDVLTVEPFNRKDYANRVDIAFKFKL